MAKSFYIVGGNAGWIQDGGSGRMQSDVIARMDTQTWSWSKEGANSFNPDFLSKQVFLLIKVRNHNNLTLKQSR